MDKETESVKRSRSASPVGSPVDKAAKIVIADDDEVQEVAFIVISDDDSDTEISVASETLNWLNLEDEDLKW